MREVIVLSKRLHREAVQGMSSGIQWALFRFRPILFVASAVVVFRAAAIPAMRCSECESIVRNMRIRRFLAWIWPTMALKSISCRLGCCHGSEERHDISTVLQTHAKPTSSWGMENRHDGLAKTNGYDSIQSLHLTERQRDCVFIVFAVNKPHWLILEGRRRPPFNSWLTYINFLTYMLT